MTNNISMSCPNCNSILILEKTEWGFRTKCKTCWYAIMIIKGANTYT